MKKYILVFIVALFASCSQSDNISENTDSTQKSDEVVCNVTPLDYIDLTGGTRSTLDKGSAGMDFQWEEGEKITVFADAQNKGDFSLTEFKSEDKSTARFTGGGFSLTKDKTYYTFSKSTSAYGNNQYNYPSGENVKLNTDNMTNISMTYSGQRMTSNGSTAHLGKYDYMTAKAVAIEQNQATFNFQHLGLTLRLVINNLPAGVEYSNLRIYDASDNSFRELKRSTNITNSSDASSYVPFLQDPDLTSSSLRFSIDLGSDAEHGISVSSGESLEVFMEVPPMDFTGKTIAVRLTPKNSTNKAYFGTYKGFNMKAGKAYKMTINSQECSNFNVNVKVEHDWVKGNVKNVDITRSTGDPGITDTDALPTYLYAFFCNNGKLVQKGTLSSLTSENWSTQNGTSTLVLSSDKKWSVEGESTKEQGTSLVLDNSDPQNPRVYMIATNEEIKSWKTSSGVISSFSYGTETGTDESVIQSLVYDYTSNIKNIYTTPYAASDFTGNLSSEDDVKDVHLYHVASKVDINWENNTTTALSGSVSVNNFPTSNLSFFKPTTGNTTPGTSSVSEAITTGTMYNGRAVFYLPQPYSNSSKKASYSVTLGSTQSIDFTPDATYTSWFRGLVTVKNYPNQ